MTLAPMLKIAVTAAALYAAVSLLVQLLRVKALGTKRSFARPAGRESDGIRYAFFRGMLPWEKESVALHLPTFVGGLLYHAGIFVGLAYLVSLILGLILPPVAILGARVVMLAGAVAGLVLLVKRLTKPELRLISVPDDIISNAVVDIFLMSGIAATMSARLTSAPLIMAIILFLYVPMGKIRHCVFFFWTRILFGRLFGRRSVLPHPVPETREAHR